ncbi:hypothetical protein SASPL_109165 [Salvia splendens]|uniref:Major facilitator superfamily (MFS) profile domain-containing protein n=1 Tax=Salvia splendens TaxID=180675 RepID=A0A8X8YJH0_SALSN|nr:hypothetical protein SASPL_109165 [Salvia splendens]
MGVEGVTWAGGSPCRIGALKVVDTPNSLMECSYLDEGKAVLKRIRGTDNVDPEFHELVEASRVAKLVKHPFRNLLMRRNRLRINAIMFYAPVLFDTVGFGSDAALYSAVITGAVNVLSTVVSIYSVDRVGRRVLLLQARVQMFLSQVVIAVVLGIKVKDHSLDLSHGYAIFVVILICLFVSAFAWSWGPLGWLIPTQAFLSMLCHFKFGIFFFSGWVLVMSLFVLLLVPETKNVPIEEMTERVWNQHWLWKRLMDDHYAAPVKNGHGKGFDPHSQL